jgi:hypothetical protein
MALAMVIPPGLMEASVTRNFYCWRNRRGREVSAVTMLIFGLYWRKVACGRFRSVLAYQAHRLDPDFCGRFYRAESV